MGFGAARDRRSVLLIALAVCLASAGLPSTVAAQERRGLWLSVGSGVGSVGLSGEDVAGEPLQNGRDIAFVFQLGAGWSVDPRTAVGVELKWAGWNISGDPDLIRDAAQLAAIISRYRSAASGLFVKGGVAASSGSVGIPVEDEPLHGGLGVTAGVGYDFRRSRRFSFTPAVGFWWGQGRDDATGPAGATRWTHNVIDVTMAFKFD